MYYVEQDGQIVLYDEDRQVLENTLEFTPQYAGLEIKVTDRPIVDFEWADTPEWEAEQARKEREKLDGLALTPADVERALYKAKGMDFEDLKALIAEKAPQLDIKALAIEFRANNFYRGATVNGMRLIDTVGALLGYPPDAMDYLFIHKELPAPDNEEV
jgi:hypothetical protein